MAYLNAVFPRHIEAYKLLFAHGIKTLLTPSFDMPLMKRGDDYMQMAAKGLEWVTNHPVWLDFYKTFDVRVCFYGEYRKHLTSTPYAYLSDMFDALTQRTKSHQRHQLFFGLFVQDAAETLIDLSIQHYTQFGVPPSKQVLIEKYYGEALDPVDIFIGFSKLRAFDMPLLMTGKTDLYFTVSPSLYLGTQQLRSILYDHIYNRKRSSQTDYGALSADEQAQMRNFYHTNLEQTLGIGNWHPEWQFWYPLPQVKQPQSKV
jgi:hypothetical protein